LLKRFAPYGTAKVDMHAIPVTDTVFDVNYDDPQKLNLLYNYIKNTQKVTHGKVVVVTHGPELRAFAKENYQKIPGCRGQDGGAGERRSGVQDVQ